ncbi:MAG: type IV pilin protein [Cellvibrionaceae bacterium]
MKKHTGFTLIELMIVVAIVAILAAVGIPSYQQYVTKTKRTDCQGVLVNFSLSMERFFAGNNTYDGAAVGSATTGIPLPTVFPSECPLDSGTKTYDLTIEAADASSYVLRATPKAASGQSNDGLLEYTSAGIKRWDRNNSGTIDAGEDKWKY